MFGSTVLTGIFFSTTKGTKGKAQKQPLCDVVLRRGKVFWPETGRPGVFSLRGEREIFLERNNFI